VTVRGSPPARTGPEVADTGPIAAVDCGSNSTRLLVIDGQGSQLARLMRITRLGKGVDATGLLDREAIARTVTVLEEYRKVLDGLGVRAVRMAATSAVRDAANGQEFLDAASRAIGAQAELLSGEEEGRLAFAGATSDLPVGEEITVVVDIGGGSTELIAGAAGSSSSSVTAHTAVAVVGGASPVPAVASLDLGCVRLTERFFHHDPPLAQEQAVCRDFVASELDKAARAIPTLVSEDRSGRRLIGLAGTVSTLSMLDQGLVDYDWRRVHHSVLELGAVERWCGILADEPSADRARHPGMVEGREDVIAAGALVLREVMQRFLFASCLVSETDILDGLAATLRSVPR
jgi:exopolyphosphatase / guanosine-5'-triphosphate,3'-diphosphate pyrophosphatase